MSFRKAIKKTIKNYSRFFRRKITAQSLSNDLHKAKICPGDTILVHSSLSKIGNVENGPQTVIESLITVIGDDGNIVMPAYSYQNTMKETVENAAFVFDLKNSPSVVGKITEEFRKRKDVKRSAHPTHSFCARGKDAEFIINGHLEATNNFGKDTPFERVRQLNGKIVGLGITLGPVTFYHTLEDFFPELFPDVYEKKSYTLKVLKDEKITEKKIQIHDPKFHKERIDKTEKIESWFHKHLKKKRILHEGQYGSTNIWWMNSNELFDELLKLRQKNITIYNVPSD